MPQAQQPLTRQTLLAVRLVSLSYIYGLPGRGNPAGAILQGCIWLHLGNPDAPANCPALSGCSPLFSPI